MGSAKTLLQGLSQPQFSSTPAVSSSSNRSALVPEEEYLADDWLEDDLGEIQPKKKRRLRVEQNGMNREDGAAFSAAKSQNRHLNSNTNCRGNVFIFILVFYFILLHIALLILPSLCCSSFRFCSSLILQQESLSEKEWLSEASPGQNDSDARHGEAGQTRGQQVSQPHDYG